MVQACGGAPPPAPECKKPAQLVVRLEPNAILNQDREGNPRSVVLRLYQLEGADAFLSAGFEDIWASGGAGPSVVAGPDELTVIPGRVETRTMLRNPKATHFGVAGKFRVVQEAPGFRAVAVLPEAPDPCRDSGAATSLQAYLMNYTIQLQ
ncbi:MAG: hypothetical protein JWN04_5967 [Myxococcaceae bacterium]|nr:hypothetical protein [Myxococcaceae bacterium]